jgi:hypothetical protein
MSMGCGGVSQETRKQLGGRAIEHNGADGERGAEIGNPLLVPAGAEREQRCGDCQPPTAHNRRVTVFLGPLGLRELLEGRLQFRRTGLVVIVILAEAMG